jgi:hypothetical protein
MARAKVISQLVAGSQPSLSVTGRADGGGYTVTAGARSLSITAEAGATLLTTVKDQDNASITVTDSTSTTPSWTAPGGGTTGADYCVQVTATKGGYTEQVSFSELVDGSGGGGGGGETVIYSLDLTTDLTDHTFTVGGGDETVYEADGTTPKFVGGLVERLGPATGGARVTAAAGGLNVDCSGATRALDAYIKLTEAETGVDWSDPTKVYAIDYLLTDIDAATNSDAITVQAGTVTTIAGTSFGVQFRRVGSSNYWDRGRRYVGSGQVGANQNNQTTQTPTRSVRIIVEGGTKTTVYWTEGTAFLSGVPVPSATVFKSATGCEGIGLEASPEQTFGDPFYVNLEALSFAAAVTQGTLTKLQISEL